MITRDPHHPAKPQWMKPVNYVYKRRKLRPPTPYAKLRMYSAMMEAGVESHEWERFWDTSYRDYATCRKREYAAWLAYQPDEKGKRPSWPELAAVIGRREHSGIFQAAQRYEARMAEQKGAEAA